MWPPRVCFIILRHDITAWFSENNDATNIPCMHATAVSSCTKAFLHHINRRLNKSKTTQIISSINQQARPVCLKRIVAVSAMKSPERSWLLGCRSVNTVTAMIETDDTS